MKQTRYPGIYMFIATKIWNQHRYPPLDEWIKKMVHTQTQTHKHRHTQTHTHTDTHIHTHKLEIKGERLSVGMKKAKRSGEKSKKRGKDRQNRAMRLLSGLQHCCTSLRGVD